MRTVALTIAALLLCAAPAQAEFGLQSFSAPLHDAAGTELTQAGAHPDSTVEFQLNRANDLSGGITPDGSLRNVSVTMPKGFVGNAEAAPECAHRDFRVRACSDLTMVGVSTIGYSAFPLSPGDPDADPPVPPQEPLQQVSPVYNLVPEEGQVARLGFQVVNVSVIVTITVGPDGGYRLAADLTDISESLMLYSSKLTLWGVPADRNGPGPFSFSGGGTYGGPGAGPRIPFLTAPTRCDEPLTTSIGVESWQRPGEWASDEYTTAAPLQGCEQLVFDPSLAVLPSSPLADDASGYAVDVRVPQNEDPDGLATPTLRDAVVTLPEGVTVSPSSATGLLGCGDAEFAAASTVPAACPSASRIGGARIETPVLGEPLTGGVFVGQPLGDDPASGRMFRIFVEARGAGVTIKLEGQVRADPLTGRLTTVFADNPQLPFSSLRLSFDGGPNAALANPPSCGPKTASARFAPWSGATPAEPSSTFGIDCAGLGGFAPSLSAGTATPLAGAFSPLAVRIERADRQGYLQGVTLELPPGLLAKLRGVPLCADALAAAGACPLASRIGSAVVGAGPGTAPFTTAREHGSVYLTEGYEGAPYGLAVVVRALAGPYDLGTVVVRQAVRIDRDDAHLTIVSDPLPQILKGVPLRLRTVQIDVDRPGFALNPTSCAQRRIAATLAATGEATHAAAVRFQVGGCAALPFRPRLRLSLLGRRQMDRGGHPGLRADLRQGAGQSGIGRVAVKLPLSLALDADNAQGLCEFADGRRDEPACAKKAVIGRAVAYTRILDRPLRGPVYFVKNVRTDRRTGRQIRTLPSLVIPLRGQVAINLRASTSVERGKLVSTFAAVPDAPISRFALRLYGGRHGVLASTRRLCTRPRGHVADVEIDGQARKRADHAVRIALPCKP